MEQLSPTPRMGYRSNHGRQAYKVVEQFLISMREHGYPELRPLLCIGGVDMRSQLEVVKKGVHIVVATPRRLKDMLAE
ncbi:unnamed protein product [Ilex paraguariensis]|uniref:Uncharacterized protein n=1 Tax=Ilex paraguariensis TaxID=185542 RepID=A0ABC8QYZ3_9AQUA